MVSKKYLLFFIALSLGYAGNAQVKPSENSDSASTYKNFEDYSKKRKFTKFIHKLLFKPAATPQTVKKKKKGANDRTYSQTYASYEGKVIRKIHIITMDPFGYSIYDSTEKPSGFLNKTGNFLHLKTLNYTIKNLLLIKSGKPYDSLRVKESERLVRSQSYIKDVVFSQRLAGKNRDSVDIYIRAQDLWTLVPTGELILTHLNTDIADKNFLGLGHQVKYGYDWNFNTKSEHEFSYYIPNIKNSYVNIRYHYQNDIERNYIMDLGIDRPFFSPLTKWGGGAFFIKQLYRHNLYSGDSISDFYTFNYITHDYWAGRAWQIFKGHSEDDRFTNLIFSLRFIKNYYLEKPSALFDTTGIYSDNNFYMGQLAITTRRYEKDKYIFRFGYIEDVPIGRAYRIVGGYNTQHTKERWYIGMSVSWGSYIPRGYISYFAEYGSFINATKYEQGVFSIGTNYFSNLWEARRWKIRQFIKTQITLGINRIPGDKIIINEDRGLQGFNSDSLVGTHKLIVTFQTQSYAPWSLIGFRFGPYFNLSCGLLGDETSGFQKSRLYSQIAVGLLIRNDYFVFNTFQVSVAFYPIIPGKGNNIFKVNPIHTTDFGFRDFSISKPVLIAYE